MILHENIQAIQYNQYKILLKQNKKSFPSDSFQIAPRRQGNVNFPTNWI